MPTKTPEPPDLRSEIDEWKAAILYRDEISGRRYTPLQCVELVRDVEVLRSTVENGRIAVRCEFDVAGTGRWAREIAIIAPGTSRGERLSPPPPAT